MPTHPRARYLATVLTVCACMALPATSQARSRRAKSGVKKLAMERFSANPRDVKVIGTAEASGLGAAALVRVESIGAPACYLLHLDGTVRTATRVTQTLRLPVCAVYEKHARLGRLKAVKLTTRRSAFLVYLDSKRADIPAQGTESRRLWGIYAKQGEELAAVFERTSTSFESKKNKAVNQTEVCKAPDFVVGDEPTSLSVKCVNAAMHGPTMDRRESTVHYRWQDGRFVLR